MNQSSALRRTEEVAAVAAAAHNNRRNTAPAVELVPVVGADREHCTVDSGVVRCSTRTGHQKQRSRLVAEAKNPSLEECEAREVSHLPSRTNLQRVVAEADPVAVANFRIPEAVGRSWEVSIQSKVAHRQTRYRNSGVRDRVRLPTIH